MSLSEAEKEKCAEWCRSPNRTWQVLNRGRWKYKFHPKTLVRFVEEAKMDEGMVKLLLEYLGSDDCKDSLQLYGQSIGEEWTPIRAWYEISNRAVGSVHAVRLYHAVQTDVDADADGPYVVEDGCAYKVSLSYYWSQPTVIDVPKGRSGVSYRIVNLSRDQDTGLYTYALETRERVRQDVEEYLMRTTLFEDQSEEVHLGVRGDESAGGKKASVSKGRTVTRKVSKNADCTHDVHNTITEDKAVPGAAVTVAETIRGKVVTTENRNMSSAAPTDGLAPGESVRNQQTDSLLWNQTIRKLVRDALSWIRESCRDTIFGHSHSKTVSVSTDPGFTHAEEAADGVVHSKSAHRTEDGWDVTDETTTEKPVREASVEFSKTLRGVRRTVTDRHQREPLDGSDMEIGERRSTRMTDGGLHDNTRSTMEATPVGVVAKEESDTIYEHGRSRTSNIGRGEVEPPVETAGGGVTHRASQRLNEEGTRDETVSEHREKPVRDAQRTASMTLNGLVVRTVHRNQDAPLPDPVKIGESVTNVKTPGGLYDVTEAKDGATGAGRTGEECSRDFFTHVHSVTKNESELQDPEEAFEVGRIVRKSGHLTGNGTANNTTSETVAVPRIYRYRYEDESGLHYVVQYRNQPTEINDAPKSADKVTHSDSLNSFGLHDGGYTYSFLRGRWKFSTADYKFVKHGKRQVFFDVERRRRTRVWSHRKIVVEARRIRGDAFWDYLNELARADPQRNTPGTLGVRLVGVYSDSDGNLLAEWVQVDLIEATRWTLCDRNCSRDENDHETYHEFVEKHWSNDCRFIIREMLESI